MGKKKKHVYFYGFGAKHTEGNAAMKDLLGGKGANLAEMARADLPVPPGFTITTAACREYSLSGKKWPPGLAEEIEVALAKLEKMLGKKLGDPNDPLLVSVRSGAAVSMPGMMDTVLNLGLNDRTVRGLIAKTGNERLGWDAYRRFIDMFGDVVMGPYTGLTHEDFEAEMRKLKEKYNVRLDTDLTAAQLKELVGAYKEVYRRKAKKSFPQEAKEQLRLAINAVFDSWDSERAVKYRQINKIGGLWGTAVNICTMVFGNMGQNSGTGVGFTRNPATGDKQPLGEYLVNAQGEDVVAGIRTPSSIADMPREKEPVWQEVHQQLLAIMSRLEKHYRDMQDVEFTIEDGKLWMLQTRAGQRTGLAAVKIACDMVDEGLIKPAEAVMRIEGEHLCQLLFPIFDPQAEKKAAAATHGLPAGPGAAAGKVVFTAQEAEEAVRRDKRARVILVRRETSAEDVGGMWAAQGILTSTGGMTSHAAVVARGWGKCCVCGASEVVINYEHRRLTINGTVVKEGDYLSLNGSTGAVYAHQDLPTTDSPVVAAVVRGEAWAREHPLYQMYRRISAWADEFRIIGVRANADKPGDAATARAFGAEGIGLTRTEHMFFDNIVPMRQFILAEGAEARQKAVDRLLPLQRQDFEGIFQAMDGLPVTIRLLDPPLHEFLPQDAAGQKEMAEALGVEPARIAELVQQLHEANPMLGHRGCRLSVTYPELAVMQTRAIIEAACNVAKKGVKVLPEIMVPVVGIPEEIEYLDRFIRQTADEIIRQRRAKVRYLVGTMIELPRACVLAGEIARSAEFFSFGTNDLTQMTFGFSRDDVGTFLPDYLDKKLLPADPFQSLDQRGVGQLVEMGLQRGRAARPDLKVGICGEHGGDPESVKFCHQVGMNYVSCSPFRVPVARLAAAQAAIADGSYKKKRKGRKIAAAHSASTRPK